MFLRINAIKFYVIRRAGLVLILVVLLTACPSTIFNTRTPFVPGVSHFRLPASGTDAIGNLVAVHAHAQDTLLDLARYFDVGHDEILNANPKINPPFPGKGTRVLLPTQHILPPGLRQGIVINLAALRLYYYPAHGKTVITHPTGIGRENWATPEGITSVIAKEIDPPWRVPFSIRTKYAAQGNPLPALVPPGPNNPLGQYALRLDIPGYLIHGTNQPHGIGMRVSHGCIQLYPEDISALFPNVPLGTLVAIINRAYIVGHIAGRPYLEAHPSLEDDPSNPEAVILARLRQAVQEAGVNFTTIDWNRAVKVVRLALGVPLPIYPGAPSVESVLAAVSVVKTPVIAEIWDSKKKSK